MQKTIKTSSKTYTGLGEPLSRIYMAQLLNTIDYLQGMQMIHRDLQPKNIAIDDNMNLKVTNFSEAMNVNVELHQ